MRNTKTEKTVFAGSEPNGTFVRFPSDEYSINLMRCLSWYNYDGDQVLAKKYALEYCKKYRPDDLKAVTTNKDTKFSKTICWVMRLVSRGAVIAPDDQIKIDRHIDALVEQEVKPVVVTPEAKPTGIQINTAEDRMREYLGDIEGAIDDWMVSNKPFDVYKDLKRVEAPKTYTKYIVELMERKLKEMYAVSTDKYLQEAWSNLTAAKLKRFIQFLEAIKSGAEEYGQFKKSVRKPRTRKTKTPVQLIAKLKYKLEDTEYSIKSALATDIIGAEQLWVFNTKTRKLGVYRAIDSKGLTVQGSSIVNFDPKTSMQKTLRKPKDILTECVNGGKLVLRKLLDQINAKDSPMNGRINTDMILIRIVK